MDVFGGGGFPRLRIGVGRPEPAKSVTDHVLGRLSEEERRMKDDYVLRARQAVETVLSQGAVEGMNRYNDKRMKISAKR
jgi:PTH1 family peptidyl-tRNA hydrolase